MGGAVLDGGGAGGGGVGASTHGRESDVGDRGDRGARRRGGERRGREHVAVARRTLGLVVLGLARPSSCRQTSRRLGGRAGSRRGRLRETIRSHSAPLAEARGDAPGETRRARRGRARRSSISRRYISHRRETEMGRQVRGRRPARVSVRLCVHGPQEVHRQSEPSRRGQDAGSQHAAPAEQYAEPRKRGRQVMGEKPSFEGHDADEGSRGPAHVAASSR